MTKLILVRKSDDPLWKITKELKEARITKKRARDDFERAARQEQELIDRFNQARLAEFKRRIAREGMAWCSIGDHVATTESLCLFAIPTVSGNVNIYELHTSCGNEETFLRTHRARRVASRHGRLYFAESEKRESRIDRKIKDRRDLAYLPEHIAKKWNIPPPIEKT